MSSPHSSGRAAATVLASFETLAEGYEARLRATPLAPACCHFDVRQQRWIERTWADLAARAAQFGAVLRSAGVRTGERVAVQLPNGPDWIAVDWAIQRAGGVTVGLFTDETPAGAARLLADCEARVLITRDLPLWTAVSGLARLPALRAVVPVEGRVLTTDRRVRTLPPDTGATFERPVASVEPEALASLVYTSGTTGLPRAVMLSQRNLAGNAWATAQALGLRADDRVLSHLPLAHLFGRVVCVYGALISGACLVFGRGIGSLVEDLGVQRPTVLIGVPRTFERLYADWMQRRETGPATRRTLFRFAVDAGWQARYGVTASGRSRRWLPAAVMRRFAGQLQTLLGGRLRLAVSGGAALPPQIGRVFGAFGVPLIQGYGLTEAGPVVSVDRPADPDPASCGDPLPGVETRIEASGELWVRGPWIMQGYWRDPEATRACLDDAGWLRTGDKVSRLQTERVYLIGRLKELLVTSTGEKVSPAEIERRLAGLPLVDQVMVVGEARPYLTALIVPRSGPLALLRAELGINDGDDSRAARDVVEAAVLVPFPWTAANGLLTETQKLRRGEIARAHAEDIARAYGGVLRADVADGALNAALGG